MILKRISIVVTNKKNSPARKIISAIFSYLALGFLLLRMDKNDITLLIINITMAKAVSSSINVSAVLLVTFKEVSTIKQSPSKVAAVFSMCGALSFLSSIILQAKGLRVSG